MFTRISANLEILVIATVGFWALPRQRFHSLSMSNISYKIHRLSSDTAGINNFIGVLEHGNCA